MAYYLLLILILAITLYLGLIFESSGLILLGMAGGVLGAVSFLMLFFVRRQVRTELLIPLKMAQKNQKIGLRFEVENASRLPVGRIGVILKYGESRDSKRQRVAFELHEITKGRNVRTMELEATRSGYYEFSAHEIRIYDVFGLFYLNQKKRGIAHAMILPEITEVPVRIGEAVRNFYGESVAYDELRPGNDPGELFDVREFREGDKLQKVHWSLSARMDELLIKEDSQPKSCAVLLLMPEGPVGEMGSLDYMASLSYTLMDQKCAHYMVWYSRSRSDILRTRVEDEESFYFALTAFLQDGAVKCEGDRLELYREKYRGDPFLHSVLADDGGRISLDGGEPARISNLQEELLLR